LKVATVVIVVSFFCFFLAVYFAMLPQYVIVNEHLKAQLLALATSFFVGGMVLIIFFAIIKISGKLFSDKNTCL
jgi:VIT1/CCC1 family predicted Fe2+/Mn2+ transporter